MYRFPVFLCVEGASFVMCVGVLLELGTSWTSERGEREREREMCVCIGCWQWFPICYSL